MAESKAVAPRLEKRTDEEKTGGTHDSLDAGQVERGSRLPETATSSPDAPVDGPTGAPKDEYLVDWDGPDDPQNPLNWSRGKKAAIMVTLSALTFVTPLASSMFAPGVQYVAEDFHEYNTILDALVVSVYLIGYAFGPLLCAPLCEIYGRAIVYQVTIVLFVIFTIACAVAPTFGSLVGFRFLAGSAGSAPLILGGGTIADMYVRERRGAKIAIFSLGPLFGPVIGPVAGAFLAEDVGWRWVFWVIAIAGGVVAIAALTVLHETYEPVLLSRKAAKLRKEKGDDRYHSRADTGDTPQMAIKKAIVRPVKMFTRSPLVFLFATYISLVYGLLYLLFVTITDVFEDTYGWSTGIAGLSYLGIGIGLFLGVAIFGATTDRRLRNAQAKAVAAGKDKNDVPPETRLPPMIPAAFFIPVAMFWYGWSAEKKLPWIMPVIGTGWFGLGMMGIFLSVQSYLIDCYPLYAASVTSTHTILRSLLGAFLPLAGVPLYDHLGLGWGNSVLGFIAAAMIPLPVLLLRYGQAVRTNPRFQIKL